MWGAHFVNMGRTFIHTILNVFNLKSVINI